MLLLVTEIRYVCMSGSSQSGIMIGEIANIVYSELCV